VFLVRLADCQTKLPQERLSAVRDIDNQLPTWPEDPVEVSDKAGIICDVFEKIDDDDCVKVIVCKRHPTAVKLIDITLDEFPD
jgi:hypothetical protein